MVVVVSLIFFNFLYLFLWTGIYRIHPEILFFIERTNTNYNLFHSPNDFIITNSTIVMIIHILYPLCNTTLHITTPTLFVAGSNSERITIRRPFATEGSTLNFQHNQGRNPLSVFECPYVRITIFWTRKKTIVLRIPIQSGDGQVVLIVTSVINTLLLRVYEVTSNLQIEANCNFHIWQYPLNSLMLPRSLQYQSIESISNEFYHRSSNDKITS